MAEGRPIIVSHYGPGGAVGGGAGGTPLIVRGGKRSTLAVVDVDEEVDEVKVDGPDCTCAACTYEVKTEQGFL